MNQIALTNQQALVLSYIKSFIRAEGYPPTQAEISKHFKWSSATAAKNHLVALGKKGAIKVSPGIQRGIKCLI